MGDFQITMFTVGDFGANIPANIPDEALVYVRTDCSSATCPISAVVVTRSPIEAQYQDPNSLIWEFDGYEKMYDDYDLAQYNKDAPITAICLCGDVYL